MNLTFETIFAEDVKAGDEIMYDDGTRSVEMPVMLTESVRIIWPDCTNVVIDRKETVKRVIKGE